MSGKDGATAPDMVEDALGYTTEYAKSNRSTCQVCKEKIEKGILRLGVLVPNPYKDGATMALWGHPECIFEKFKKPGKPSSKQKHLTTVDEIQGYDDLKAKDKKILQKLVEDHVAATTENLPQEGDWTELVLENQFWKIACLEDITHTSYGIVDQRDQALSMVKEHPTPEAALAYKEKMIKDKIKKGYHPADDDDNNTDDNTDGGEEEEEEKEPAKKKSKTTEKEAEDKKTPTKKAEKKEEDGEEEGEAPAEIYGFKCEYAKSNRSRCKGCNTLIDKGELRMAKLIDNPYVPRKDPDVPIKMPVWYTMECFWKNQRKGTLSKKTRLTPECIDNDELEGYDALKKADQKKLKDRIQKENDALQSFATPTKEATTSAASTATTPQQELQVYLEATSGDHNKWWGISRNDKTTKTRWGEIGDLEGHFVLKEFKTQEEAIAYQNKMITTKLGTKCAYELIALEGKSVKEEDREERAKEFVPSPPKKKSSSPKKKSPAKRKRS